MVHFSCFLFCISHLAFVEMKLEGDNGFHKLAVESILSMCMNDINGKRIQKVEGCLSLTVESGEVFCIVIKEDLNSDDDDKRIRKTRKHVSKRARNVTIIYSGASNKCKA